MRRERPGHSLPPSAVVHEAVIRLLGEPVFDKAADRSDLFARPRRPCGRSPSATRDEILRRAPSIRQGTVTASVRLRKLGSDPRRDGLAVIRRELGRIGRSLFTLGWLQDVELRRRVQAGLNKCEASKDLARALFFSRLAEMRDRSFEDRRHRASGRK
jgi:TnpA family transposase